MTLTILIAIGLFAATLIGGKARQTAQYAAPDDADAHTPGAFHCRADRCRELRRKMWLWYRMSGARCIREHEGPWHDPADPYHGGFQADQNFMRAYGVGLKGGHYLAKWGPAENWPHWRQIHMAYRGYLARGWQPWPTTSVICGLA